MTIKIKAPKAYMSEWTIDGKVVPCEISWYATNIESGTNKQAVRCVSESDWRKLMKLVRAAENHCIGREKYISLYDVYDALEALEKKK